MNGRCAVLAVLLAAAAVQAAEPVLNREDAGFLREQARRLVAAARLAPGAASGKYVNSTRYALHVPGGNMGYPAFWVRDAVMMLGGDFVPAEEMEGWIRLMASTIRSQEWQVHAGAVVPAYAVPDHINFDGRATFYPGTYDSGAKQGGKPFGKYPPLDDHFYFIEAVYQHWKATGSVELFRAEVAMAEGKLELARLCERVYRVAPVDAATGLVTAGDVESENAKDWGFCDTVFKSGRLLFPSVLKYNAANELAELFEAAGDGTAAARYRGDARRLRGSISRTFRRSDGWLRSATGVGNQPDVWGTAFAVWSGAVDGKTGERASRALVKAYRDGTAVRDGLVRHVPANDGTNGGLWQSCVAAAGTYQNGGYWGTPVGWYVAAMQKSDPGAARQMAGEFAGWLRRNVRADGTSEAWEWVNPVTGVRRNELYVASVALPYLSLVQAGLIAGGAATRR